MIHEDLIGRRFNNLKILSIKKIDGRIHAICLCRCGVRKMHYLYAVRMGKSKSCGCLMPGLVAKARTIHGDNKRGGRTLEYRTWAHIIARCTNPKLRCFKYYGGRGITICRRWRKSFAAFLGDMGRKPKWAHSIDRIKNNKNYTPGNCRWATRSQQNKNRRPFKRSK